MVKKILLALLPLLVLSGCATFHYESTHSRRAVTECIASGWENSNLNPDSQIPVMVEDLTDSFLLVAALPSPFPSGTKHPKWAVWAEVHDKEQGSTTEYRRVAQFFHEKLDYTAQDCQQRAEEGAPVPFVDTETTPSAIIEGQFIRHSTFNWDNVTVKAVDRHLLILKPNENGDTLPATRITTGEHLITVALTYNHNNWPRFMSIDMPATIVANKHYILVAIDNGDDHILELQDKETGENVFHPQPASTDGKRTIVPPPAPIVVPLMRF